MNVNDKLQPENGIEIEFEYGKASRFYITDTTKWNSNWNPSKEKTDSLLQQVGFDRDLNKQLKDMGCISVRIEANPESPYAIGFRSIGMEKYSYRIYPEPLPTDVQKEIQEDNYTSILFSLCVVFEYGGGAFGSQNFIGKEEYFEKKKQSEYEIDR